MLRVRNFAPVVQDRPLYPGLSFDISPGEIIGVMGHSGCGKTSLFRSLKRQIPCVGTADIEPKNIFMVFQDHDQLLPWFSVKDNLDMVCDRDWQCLVARWHIDHLITKKPGQLSVGQKQRFSLLRAICSNRDVLLCDEPLSAVDGITAITIQKDFLQIIKEKQKTCLWITHNVFEAKNLCDRIAVINDRAPTIISKPFTDEIILNSF